MRRFGACRMLFFLFALFIIWSSAPATHAYALSLAPSGQTLVLDAGETHTIFLSVTNDGQEPRTVAGEAEGFSIDPDTGAPQFGVSDKAVQWIRPELPTLRLNPGETKQYPFLITVPPDAEPGSHYIGLFVREMPEQNTGAIGARIGSLLFLHTAGDVRELLALQLFDASARIITHGNAEVFVQLYNDGTIHAIPEGIIAAQNSRGREILRLRMNEQKRMILPGGRFRETVSLGPFSWRDIGPVSVAGAITYGETHQRIVKKETVWYLPFWFIAAGAGAAGLLFFGLVQGMRLLKKRMV